MTQPHASSTTRRTVALVAAAAVTTLATGGFSLAMASQSGTETAEATGTPSVPSEPSTSSTPNDTGAPSAPAAPTAAVGALPSPAGVASPTVVAVPASDGTVEIPLAGGNLVLTEADLQLGDGGQIDTNTTGSATLELPATGALAHAVVDRPLSGKVGVASGRDLAHLGAHLRDDETYLYVDLGEQEFDIDLGLDGAGAGAGTRGLPDRIAAGPATGGSSTFVADLTGDYFYLNTPCAAMVVESQAEGDPPVATADLSGFDPDGCGIGWSAGGYVPFRLMLADRLIDIPDDFGAHLVVDGTVPLAAGLTLDGELFYRFDDDRATVWANGGRLDLGLSFLEGAAEVSLPAVQGTFGLVVGGDAIDLLVTATAGSDALDDDVALLAELAPVSGRADLDGELHIVAGDVLPTSFLQLSGDVSIAPTTVGTASGVELSPLVAAEAIVRIDSAGVTATGTVEAAPLTAISLGGSAEIELAVPFAEPAASSLRMRGRLAIGETQLGADAELRVDRDGAFARGTIDLAGFGGLEVEGWLGAGGFQLTGAVAATVPIGDLDQVAAKLVDQTSQDALITALDDRIDDRIDEIGQSDPATASTLRDTVGDLRAAFGDIASVRETIAYNDALIADLWDQHQADIDWHWSLNDFDRFWDKGPHAVRLGVILAEIEALKFANTVQYGYVDTANLAVSLAQQGVLAIVGWDAELNALVALVTEAHLATLTGHVVSTVLDGADAILDALGVDGSATGTVTFTVGTEGVAAGAALRWCRDGSCEDVAGASVTLAPQVEVCATILGVPACAGL